MYVYRFAICICFISPCAAFKGMNTNMLNCEYMRNKRIFMHDIFMNWGHTGRWLVAQVAGGKWRHLTGPRRCG